MNKVTHFLEQHVQWLTLVLALAYVGYMGYAYLYTPPLSVVVGKPPVLATPGDIDEKIVVGPVRLLDEAINDKKIEPPKVVDVLKTFDEKIGEKNVGKTELSMIIGGSRQGLSEGADLGPENNQLVSGLPKSPPALPVLTAPASAQWTVITVPGATPRQDVAYFMGAFTIDMGKLAQAIGDAFSKNKVAAGLLNAEFVRVDLYRQERLPNEQWDAPKLIAPLPVNAMEPYPGDLGKVATNQKDQQAWFNYESWAQKNQAVFIQPSFYKTAADVAKPGLTVADPVEGAPAAQPVAPPAPAAPAQPGAPVPPAVHGLINPNEGNQPAGGGALNPALVQGNLQLTVNDTTLEEGKTYRYAVQYRLYNPLYTKAALATKDVADKFDYASPDPRDLKDPNAAQLWTGPVTPAPRGYIFVQKVNPFRGEAKFSVWTWKDGHWKESTADKLSPGDPVSAVKGTSRWTLVDVRRDRQANDGYVIVMDDHGTLEQRDEKTDAASPILIKLKAAPGGTPAANAR